jgi:hypothetical protein
LYVWFLNFSRNLEKLIWAMEGVIRSIAKGYFMSTFNSIDSFFDNSI